MKYYLSTAGKKCCKGCTWLLSLARNEEGYDLIQLKRGFSQNRKLMKLYPGEPAIIMDTGEFYIGDASGRPILINPSGAAMPETGDILCIRNNAEWHQGDTVSVPYSEMITSDGDTPTDIEAGRYSCAVIINANNVPVGIGFVVDWQETELSASFCLGFFNQVDLAEFTEDDIDKIIAHAESRLDN